MVVAGAVHVFAARGYRGATMAAVAEHAAISPAYASKLFASKERLFVAALEECFERIAEALARAVDSALDATPSGLLSAMAVAYADLIADRDLLMLQVHALAATDVPAVGDAMRAGIARVVDLVSERSGADDAHVQTFMARGQLCHLLTALDAFDDAGAWAATLTAGFVHGPGTPT